MPTPSLLIVPSRWKTGNPGKLYSQIPTNGNGDFNVTGVVTGGTSIGTRVNNLGYIEPITTSGTPRLDYYTSSGVPGCPALLVEPAATNLCRYSEQFDTVTSGWTAAGLQTITGNTTATLDPAGGNTAELIVATTGTINHDIRPSSDNLPAFVSGTTYTYSVFAKATSVTSGFLQMYLGAIGFSPASPFANFQLSGNGAITTGTYLAASIQPFGNGWYRCSITATAAANGNAAAPIQPILTSGVIRNGTFAGNGIDGVYLWGAQLETGSVATSYIPTTAGTVTRAAEVISVSGAVSGSIGQTDGTFYLDLTYAGKGAATAPWIRIFGASNFIGLSIANSDFVRTNINNQSDILTTAPLTTAGLKIVFAYNSSGVVCFINGTQYTLTNGGGQTMSSITSIDTNLGVNPNAVNIRIRAMALYTTRLTNADLMLLTMPGNNTYLPQAVWDNYLSRTGNAEVPDCLYTRHADLLDV